MSRPLSLLVLLAAPAILAGCGDGKSPLISAKPGECYSVVGRDSAGLPRMAKIPCASEQAALSCAPVAAATCPGAESTASGHKTSGRAVSRHATRRVARRSASSSSYARYDDRVARSGEVVRSLGIEYARVDSDRLLGAAETHGYARSYEREESGYHEERREEHYAPPPPPPPPPLPPLPPLPPVHARAKTIERSYSSSESSSYSSGYASSSSRSSRDCNCDHRGQGPQPRIGRDRNGYLTWPGKTPG